MEWMTHGHFTTNFMNFFMLSHMSNGNLLQIVSEEYEFYSDFFAPERTNIILQSKKADVKY